MLSSTSIHIYWQEKCFEQKLLHKTKHTLYIQYTLLSPVIFEIIKQNCGQGICRHFLICYFVLCCFPSFDCLDTFITWLLCANTLSDTFGHVPYSMHSLDVKIVLKTPTNALWFYECNFITWWPPTCTGHSCGHRKGGKSKNTIYLYCVRITPQLQSYGFG
jgi:hypothetical protein